MTMCIGAQFATQVLAPCGKKVGEFVEGQRLDSIEELITESTFCKSVSDPRPTAWKTGLMIVATGYYQSRTFADSW